MFQLSLTTYGQSLVSSNIQIDGIALTASYTSTISSLENVSSLTTVFDDDSVGNYNGSTLNIRIRDLSSSAYQAKTIVFYKLVNSVKKIVAAYSNNSAIINKTASSEVNLFLSFDASCFTHGFTLSSIQASPASASLNNDGIVHIEDESTLADDSYSVYSKPQVDSLLENKQDSLSAGDGIAITNDVVRTTGIPFGIVDDTSTSTAFTVTVPGIYKLEDGVCCLVKNGVVTSASGFTIDINGLGAKPVYSNMAAATAETTIFNINYTLLFVYDSTRVSDGCWICYRGYYSDKNDSPLGYNLRTNNTVLTVTDRSRYYKIFFTSADNTQWVPASSNWNNDTTTSRTPNQRKINPFGRIVYTSASTSYTEGTNLAATTIWDQYPVNLGYSYGPTVSLTPKLPVFVKCAPQSDGSAIVDSTTPLVQILPTTNDGKIYIFLGVAYGSETTTKTIDLFKDHPVYYHDGTSIKVWVGKDSYSKTETDTLFTSYVPTSRKVNNKALASDITLSLDDVADGSTRKLSNYVPTARTVNSKALSSNITLTASDVGALPSSTIIPTVNNSTITIKKNSDDTGDSFTTNAASAKTINLSLAAVATSGSYSDLSSKPTIPTVNNASLTINKGGTNDTASKTFTANASSNVTINLGLGEAADKAVDSSISAASTSTKLPTSQAVASFVEGKGYVTQHQSLSDLVATAQYNSTTGKIEFYNKSNTKLSTDIDATPFLKDGMIDSISIVTVTDDSIPTITLDSYTVKMSAISIMREVFSFSLSEANTIASGTLPAVVYTGNDAQSYYNLIVAHSKSSDASFTLYGAEHKYLRFHYNNDANKQDVDIELSDLSQVLEDKLKTVAFTGSYNDLANKPTIPTIHDENLFQASGVTAGSGGIFSYQLCFRVGDNLYESICTSYSSGTNKVKNPNGFYLDNILYYGNGADIPSGSYTTNSLYKSYNVYYPFSFNCGLNSLTIRSAIYLVVTYNYTDKKFYLEDTWWTQTLPSTEDGKYYVYLGVVNNNNSTEVAYNTFHLDVDHPIFYYKNGRLLQTSVEIIDSLYDLYVTKDTTQTITGIKTFSGATNFADYISFGTYHTSASTTVNTQLNVWDDTSNYAGGIDVTGNLNPAADDTYNLGSTHYCWNSVHASEFVGDLSGKLSTARKINGIEFNGSAAVDFCGICETAADTAAKTVTITGYTALQVGSIINVLFSNTNEASNPTLQVNNLDALPIYCGNTAAGTTSATSWFGSEIVTLTYSTLGGGRWYIISKMLTPPGNDTSGINLYTGYPGQICAVRSGGAKIATGWPSGVFSGTAIPIMLGAYAKDNTTPVWFCGISGVVASTLAGASAVGQGSTYSSVTRTTSASGVKAGGIGAIRTLLWVRIGAQNAVVHGTVITDGTLYYNGARTVSGTSYRLTLADEDGTVTVSAGAWVTLSYVPEQTEATAYFITAVRVG